MIERFDALLDDHFDGHLGGEHFRELGEQLRTNPELRKSFVLYNHLHRQLHDLFDDSESLCEAESLILRRELGLLSHRHHFPLGRWTQWASQSAAVSILVVAALFYGSFALLAWNLNSGRPAQDFVTRVSAAPVAVASLIGMDSCRWEKQSAVPKIGEPLPGGDLRLEAGLAEIEFAGGARVVLEGPTHFELTSAKAGFLTAGKLVARVPPKANGFTIATPVGSVVDLGTEFGLKVDAKGVMEVHVLKGAVATHLLATETTTTRLEQGQAIRIAPNGQTFQAVAQPIPFAAQDFRLGSPMKHLNRKGTRPILEYQFNDTGTTSASTGMGSTPVEFRNAKNEPADLHSAPGLGVGGDLVGHAQFGVDRAFDNTASTGMGYPKQMGGVARHAADDNSVDGLLSWTASGWFKTTAGCIRNSARLFNNTELAEGFYVYGDFDKVQGGTLDDATGELRVHVNHASSETSSYPALGYQDINKWVFFAVTYDGTRGLNNLKFYRGYRNTAEATGSENVALVATRSLPEGPVTDETIVLAIGNRAERDRPFAGFLDNMRIYGSKVSDSGVLTIEELEARRASDVKLNISTQK